MSVIRGAFDPAGKLDGIAIELVFADVRSDLAWVQREVRRIFAAGRVPLLTVEPHVLPGPELVTRWSRALEGEAGEVVYVRFMHEPNGTWYPWAGDPDRFLVAWLGWASAMPANVRNVWCVNVDYAGASGPPGWYWPHRWPGTVDVIALDGYARNGETPAELFRPTLDEIRPYTEPPERPVWITETAAPRGRTQARYAEALVAFAAQQGIEAVVWFAQDKAGQGPDEADWTLTPAAERAFLGEPARPPKRRRR